MIIFCTSKHMNWFLNSEDGLSDQIISSGTSLSGRMVAIQRLYEDASRKLILTFVLSTKNKCFRVSIMLHCTCEQINTFSGPQFTHCFILQFTLIYHSIVNLQYSFFGVIYICLKFCSLNNLCILVFFNLTKSFLKPFNHLTNLTIFSDYGT